MVVSDARIEGEMGVREVMTKPMGILKRFIADETGATAIEYGLIAALVAVAAVPNLERLGNTILGIFNKVGTTMSNNVK